MIEVEATGRVIRAVDVEKNEVEIGVEGWQQPPDKPMLDRRVDATVSGVTTALEFPVSGVTIDAGGADGWTPFNDAPAERRLGGPGHVVRLESTVTVYAAPADGFRVVRSRLDGPVAVRFDGPTAVTLGFRSPVNRPRHTVTVPRSLDGAATAIRYLGSAIDTDAPDKSYPSLRAHPPRVTFGEGSSIPAAVYRAASFSDVTLRLPRSTGALLVAAPLAFYLQADVVLEDRSGVALDLPGRPTAVRLGATRPLEVDVADLLHRAFYLDCLVRNVGPYGVPLREAGLLDRLAVDADALYDAPTAERVAAYLELDYGRVRGRLPDWHLSTVVEPTLDHLPALPHLLDRLSLVQRPDPTPVAVPTLVAESLQAAATWDVRRRGSAGTPPLVRNGRRLGRVQGWMAAGVPVDAFRSPMAAFQNRFDYHEHTDDPRSVLVVFNDESMAAERTAVERIYRERATELAMDVTVEESLGREQLADRLQSPVDFLHYVGHCDADGLRCADGSVSATDLEATRVQTFFLNACRSFEEGLALIERGSVAGAVTLHDVLNPQATEMGTTFAQLVMRGFDIALALAIARKFTIENKLYAVVGDGTHRLIRSDGDTPGINRLDPVSGAPDRYVCETESTFLAKPGGIFKSVNEVAAPHGLIGNSARFERTADELRSTWDGAEAPVFFDGRYHWSSALAQRLAGPAGVEADRAPDYNQPPRTNN
ncbi:MAG: hypothetical protein ABEJ92_04680 [Halobacteriales archaeon]